MIKEGLDKKHRLVALRKEASSQLKSLRSGSYTVGTVESPFIIEERFLFKGPAKNHEQDNIE